MSKPEKAPAFQFYPKDFLTDDKVMEMSAEVRGMYITLLCVDWLNDGFYSSAILKLGGFDWVDHDGALRGDSDVIKNQLLDCFEPHPTKEGFVTNPKLKKIRAEQLERREERIASGKKGADKKWAELHASQTNGDDSATQQPIAKNGSSSSSPSSSSLSLSISKGDAAETEYCTILPSLDTPECREALKNWQLQNEQKFKRNLSVLEIHNLQMEYVNRPKDFIRDITKTIARGWKGIRDCSHLEREAPVVRAHFEKDSKPQRMPTTTKMPWEEPGFKREKRALTPEEQKLYDKMMGSKKEVKAV